MTAALAQRQSRVGVHSFLVRPAQDSTTRTIATSNIANYCYPCGSQSLLVVMRPARNTSPMANPTTTFRLPSGATTAVRRREHSRRTGASPYGIGTGRPVGLRRPRVHHTISVPAALVIFDRKVYLASRKRLFRARIMHKEQRSRSSSQLSRTVVPEQITSGTPSSSKTSGVPLDDIRKALPMTRVSNDSDSSSSNASMETMKTKRQHPSRRRSQSTSRPRSKSELGPYGFAETESVTRQKSR
ncbi:uncharacterized protein M421DRAFT_298046 [Didymella exigua CBS 183.55]|uniref:Uncharacterized protein n=1 Tax=Didymella exigua CBS 183.55 TaxID=1150837 RepID=A0A6A5R963_9PLEO|nr:uncharacterized protein M421DRAFT_298046 [Didymella exigua CBS 183.55]KAF1924103.1 hypothetical protein M421DRAFT_298046 [Didymella exigua CBS 183.55]